MWGPCGRWLKRLPRSAPTLRVCPGRRSSESPRAGQRLPLTMLLAPIGELGVVEMQVPSPPHRRPEIRQSRATPDVLPATHVGSSSPNEEAVVPAARSPDLRAKRQRPLHGRFRREPPTPWRPPHDSFDDPEVGGADDRIGDIPRPRQGRPRRRRGARFRGRLLAAVELADAALATALGPDGPCCARVRRCRDCPVAEALVAWIGVGIMAPLVHRRQCRRRRRDGRSCACSRRGPGQRWSQIGRRRVRAAECCSPARCSTVVRAPAEKARPDGLLDAGLRVLALHPSRSRDPGPGGWVVSLIEPQRRDQDVALPHVTDQIPIERTDHRPARPRRRAIDQPSS
jgi:hypothetical protein